MWLWKMQLHRRDELRAEKILQDSLFACHNVELVWDSVPVSVEGEDKVTALKVRNVKTDEEKEISVDGVFIAVGIVPGSGKFKDLVKMDESGYIIAGEDGDKYTGHLCRRRYPNQESASGSNCSGRWSQCSGICSALFDGVLKRK